MKILCVCAGGNTRSVTLATLLKYQHGKHDALAASIERNSQSTLDMLYAWANKVIAVDYKIYEKIISTRPDLLDDDKLLLINIGQDKWGMSMHPDLVPIASKLLDEAGFMGHEAFEERMARIQAKGTKYELRRAAASS